MTNALIKKEHTFTESDDLNLLLLNLKAFGRPRVSCMKDGNFYAVIDMYVSSKGVAFEIKSGMSEPTPLSAVKELIKRLKQTLEDLKS